MEKKINLFLHLALKEAEKLETKNCELQYINFRCPGLVGVNKSLLENWKTLGKGIRRTKYYICVPSLKLKPLMMAGGNSANYHMDYPVQGRSSD